MNKLTDGDSFQFALKPPQYQGLCLPNNGDWGWRRVPAAEAHGKIPDPLPSPVPISEWGPDGYSCFKALFPWAPPDSISDPENEVLWGKWGWHCGDWRDDGVQQRGMKSYVGAERQGRGGPSHFHTHTQNESWHESEVAGSWYSDIVLPAAFPLYFLLPKPGSPSLALHWLAVLIIISWLWISSIEIPHLINGNKTKWTLPLPLWSAYQFEWRSFL